MAFVVCLVAVFVPARADALEQPLDVTRPAGQLSIEMRGTEIVVTDTRADDPGWSVSGVDHVVATTPSFADASGLVYAQHVVARDGVAHAPAHHGLGIAQLSTNVHDGTITITVI